MPLPSFAYWLPLLAVSLHVFEEFAWPGGFVRWYEAYRPGVGAGLSRRFLLLVNALMLGLCAVAGALGATPRGMAYALAALSIMAVNALFHVRGTLESRRYSPGLVTSVALYLPLAALGFTLAWRSHTLATISLVQVAAAGPVYHVWSGWRHRRMLAARGAAVGPRPVQ